MTYKNLSSSSPISTITSSSKPQVSIPKRLLLDFRICSRRSYETTDLIPRTLDKIDGLILHLREGGALRGIAERS